MRFNPFRPTSIVSPGMFCGRLEEIESIERSLHQARNNNPQHFLIEGERGIGKSSLMLFASAIATNKSRGSGDFDFVTVEVTFGESTTYLEMVRKIGFSLRVGFETHAARPRRRTRSMMEAT